MSNHFIWWLRSVSVQKKLFIIILLIILMLLFELGNFYLSMKITNAVRSYVTGESIWSKGQKGAAGSIFKYAISSDESDYVDFLVKMQVVLDYNKVRRALEEPHPDYSFITKTWISVGIDAADVSDDYFLYRNFSKVVYMRRAIALWKSADAQVDHFIDLGHQLHDVISAHYDVSSASQVVVRNSNIAALVKKVAEADSLFTVQEGEFSFALADGARAIKNILLIVTTILTLILGVFIFVVATLIFRIIIKVDKEKTEFISIASHQLNTPLSIMKNAYAMVKDNSLTPTEGVEYWGGGLKRMDQVIVDFWNVMRSEGGMQTNIQKSDISTIAREAVEDKQHTIATTKKNINVSLQNPSFIMPLVWCDTGQINTVIYNLLDNAIAYTQEGAVTLWYELVEHGSRLKVNIADTGIGFTREDKEKMGQKFYRAKRALLSRPDGSGLGLYICKNLIENNRGKLLYESAGPNRGSIFSFTLPIVK